MGPLLRPGGPWFVTWGPDSFCGALALAAAGGHRGHGPTFGSRRGDHIVIWPHLWRETEEIITICLYNCPSRVRNFHVIGW